MKIPRHIAIIMDGNGRWAKKHRMPISRGHRKGVESLRRVVEAAIELGIEYITFYAFSIDNWKRDKKEVDSLMNLLREFLDKQIKNIQSKKNKKDVRLIIIGRRDKLPKDIVLKIKKIEKETQANTKLKMILALNYGSRNELADAIKAANKDLLENKLNLNEINEGVINRYLYTKDIPDPDLLIRTSGEMRLSNFLLWQLSYAELYFTPVYWPDFNKKHLVRAIEEFNERERRFGGRR